MAAKYDRDYRLGRQTSDETMGWSCGSITHIITQPTRHCWAEDRSDLLLFGDECFALAVPHIMPLLFLMLQKPSHVERLEADERKYSA
jgi:hypothetical protein